MTPDGGNYVAFDMESESESALPEPAPEDLEASIPPVAPVAHDQQDVVDNANASVHVNGADSSMSPRTQLVLWTMTKLTQLIDYAGVFILLHALWWWSDAPWYKWLMLETSAWTLFRRWSTTTPTSRRIVIALTAAGLLVNNLIVYTLHGYVTFAADSPSSRWVPMKAWIACTFALGSVANLCIAVVIAGLWTGHIQLQSLDGIGIDIDGAGIINGGDGISAALLQHMPTISGEASNLYDAGDEECCICQVRPTADDRIVRLPCRHEFHHSCINPWLAQRNACPICRGPVANEFFTLTAAIADDDDDDADVVPDEASPMLPIPLTSTPSSPV
jgi:hypothetical protein